MDAPFRALRYALRMLLKNPGSSAVAIVAMALGIGLTASMYSILDGVFLRGLPFEEPDRILHLECNNLSADQESLEVTQHDFEDWRAQQQSFEGIAGMTGGTFNLSDDESLPDRYDGVWVSANFLDLLRVQPIVGRGFVAADEAKNAEPVILLGYHVWQKRYGGDPDVVGKLIRVNSQPTTIVGVLPQGFRFPVNQDAWMPLILETDELQRGQGTTLEVFGRLKDGVTVERAAMELATIAQRLEQQYPETNEGLGTVVKPFIHEMIGEETRMLLKVMFVAVVLVLLIACFNVANLLIGRASARSRELAIRTALGAGRWRAVGQILAESALVALVAAGLGIVLGHFGLHAFDRALSTMNTPFWFVFEVSDRVLLFVLGITAAAALLAGLVPALQAARPDVSQVLHEASRTSTSFRMGRLSRGLVVAEVAISCALLIGAGLTVRSILAANSYELRFNKENVLTARMGLFEGDHPEGSDWVRFFEELQTRVEGKAQVVAAAIGNIVPTETRIGAGGITYERPGETYERDFDRPWARWNVISPTYFETLQVPLVAGRNFTAADREGAPAVAIVNQDFAQKEWPGEDPIGKRIDLWMGEEEESEDPEAGWVQVVGVVSNLRFADFDNDDDQQAIYLPLAQNPIRFAWIIVRTRTDPLAFAEPLRRTVLELDPNLPLYFVRSMDQVLEETMFYDNLIAVLFSIFAAAAIVLACVGLYGVMAFAVTQRTREIGVRMAFGARAGDVLGLVLKQGLRQVVVGVVLGLGLGALLGMTLKVFLFQVQGSDPVTFATVPALLVLVAVLATLVPAVRAAAVDPINALRYE